MKAPKKAWATHAFAVQVLSFLAIGCLAFGLKESVHDAAGLLSPVIFLGMLLGEGLGISHLKGWQAWGGILILGLSGICTRVGQFYIPLANLASSIPLLYQQIPAWIKQKTPPDFSTAVTALADFSVRLWTLTSRAGLWMQNLTHGKEANDPVVRALAWSLVLWLVTAWAGWFLYRTKKALLALAPALALLAIVLDFTGADIIFLGVMLFLILLLIGLTSHKTRQALWKRNGVDFSDSTSTDTTSAFIGLSVALIIAAAVTPSISVRALIGYLQEQSHSPNQTERVAESLGLEAHLGEGSKFILYMAPGLPRQHLLGTTPELSHNIVMFIQTGNFPLMPEMALGAPVPHYYWRSMTYNVYTGRGWASSPTESGSYPANTSLFNGIPAGYQLIQQDVETLRDLGDALNWSGVFLRADQPYQVAWRAHPAASADPGNDSLSSADLLGVLGQARIYHIDSLLLLVSIEELRAAPDNYPAWVMYRYLALPDSVPSRVLALGRDLTAAALTPYDRAIAIETYLRTFPYTLDIPSPPLYRDVADYFLFDLKKGYCDYYATAMVVLARAAGLPARLVVGYASGEYDAPNARYIVTEADAHSWAEVYFSGIGWVEFEPTAAQPEIIRSAQVTSLPPPILPPSHQTGMELLKGLLDDMPFLLRGSGLFAGILISALISWQLATVWWLQRSSASRAVAWIYKRVYRQGRKVTGPLRKGETAHEFAARLEAKLDFLSQHSHLRKILDPAALEIISLTNIYNQAIFSPRPPRRDDVSQAFRTWRRLRWRLTLAGILTFGESLTDTHNRSKGRHRLSERMV
jgi:transglutaminase-like putative cysteine protease